LPSLPRFFVPNVKSLALSDGACLVGILYNIEKINLKKKCILVNNRI
jgi:hypothetical protein